MAAFSGPGDASRAAEAEGDEQQGDDGLQKNKADRTASVASRSADGRGGEAGVYGASAGAVGVEESSCMAAPETPAPSLSCTPAEDGEGQAESDGSAGRQNARENAESSQGAGEGEKPIAKGGKKNRRRGKDKGQ